MNKLKIKTTQYHYFYKITNLLNNHFYYGVHNTNNLDDGYMGSGKKLHYAYKKYGIENFKKEILKYFNTSKEAFEYEAEIVNENLIKDNNCYNIQLGGNGWNTSGLVTVKDKNGKCFDVSNDDERLLNGELVGVTKGYNTVKDKYGNTYFCSIDDPRRKTGELFGCTKDMVVLRNKQTLKCKLVKKNKNIDFSKYEYIGTGFVIVKDDSNNILRVSINDPKYLSGELKFIQYGTRHTEETKNKMKKIFKEIQHQQGEKNSQYGTCWIYNNIENKKIKKEELNDYIKLGWIKGRNMKLYK